MRKSNLRDGTPMIVIKVEHFVTDSVFAYALTNHYFRQGFEFPDKLSKTESMVILKDELFFHGKEGEDWGEDNDQVAEHNPIYEIAHNWVLKNYPYLGKVAEQGNLNTKK